MIVKNVTMKYSDIFGDKIDKELANTLLEINKRRFFELKITGSRMKEQLPE